MRAIQRYLSSSNLNKKAVVNHQIAQYGRRAFTGAQHETKQQLNIIQRMPSYQEALRFASETKYEESQKKLQETIDEIEGTLGDKNTLYHLYIYQRLASIQTILKEPYAVENTFKQCIETANKIFPKNKEDASKRFMWKNNLFKFYIDFDIDKACDYGQELLHDYNQILPNHEVVDLKFSLGTSYCLQGTDLKQAQELLEESLAISGPEMTGYIHNNLGINHFYQFVEKSSSIQNAQEINANPQGIDKIASEKIEQITIMIKHLDTSISELKNSVRALENIDVRFKDLQGIHEDTMAYKEAHQPELKKASLEQIAQKLFIDEFFDPNLTKEILPKGFKHYKLQQHQVNEKFLKELIKRADSILPIQNLGEIAYILQKYQEAFALLDIALKLYRMIDMENLMKYKTLSLLGALLDSQQDQDSMMNINKLIFKSLDKHDCYEKVFALRNYGYILARNEQTRLEGNDYIDQAEKLAVNYPYWAERKMNLFVPVMAAIDSDKIIPGQ
ncbi:UNKNOWN [Stylonychia lemnae]|uniref:Uncharacterized protein n=1 Tax=Stylonychia lemnae TaxID=5949 RepID=A0A078A2F3_STYLE|nr:UNKNOWN [Stylonychia lemnae]|eukprot:CDW76305.1 UNKNOWN [Stylonychia lemnae]